MTREPRSRHARQLVLVALAVMALALAACGGAKPTPTPVPSGPLNLTGTSWLLIKYLSPDGTVFTVPSAITPQAAFTADTMSGNAGCNTFNGPYTLEGENINLGPMASTMMACQEPTASVEIAYLAALNVVDKAALLDNGNLQLWDSAGKTTLVFVKGS
jgi:heat shock protein HslJ